MSTASQSAALRAVTRAQVTVVVPIFDKADDLEACLESIACQTLSEIEIVCVDDGSADGSLEIARRFAAADQRFVVLVNQRNLGAGPARNRGLAAAHAPFVQFVDADDLLPESAVEKLLVRARADGVAMVRGSLGLVDGLTGEIVPDRSQTMPDRHRVELGTMSRLWVPYFHVCWLFSRDLLAREGIEYEDLKCGEDPPFLARALVAVPAFSTIPDVVYGYRRRPRPGRATFAHLLDFVEHVFRVRGVYLGSRHAHLWRESVERFYLDDTLLLARQCQLAVDERARALESMLRIWPDAEGELTRDPSF